MTVKQMREHLDGMPDDAQVFVQIWTGGGEENYWINYPINSGQNYRSSRGIAVMVGTADRAPAYMEDKADLEWLGAIR